MKFEEKLEKLEETVNKIENENTTLEESIEAYKKGVELSKECYEFLTKTKGKIEILTEELNTVAIDFED